MILFYRILAFLQHLNLWMIFRNGKLYPNDKPGLGVEFDPANVELVNVIDTGSLRDYKPCATLGAATVVLHDLVVGNIAR